MNLTRQVEQDLREFFEQSVFSNCIRGDSPARRPAWQAHSRTICALAAPRATIQLAKEILAHEQSAGQATKALVRTFGPSSHSDDALYSPGVRCSAGPHPRHAIGNIPISQIEPNPLQPRNVFRSGTLAGAC